jgi:predicted MFS family arabinose efflux permease
MNRSDIDLYLAVKKQVRLTRWITFAALSLAAVVLATFLVTDIESRVLSALAWGTICGVALVAIVELVVGGPRERLLGIIERQISKDPDALRYLAKR